MVKTIALIRQKWIFAAITVAILMVLCIGLIVQHKIKVQAQERDLKMARVISENSIETIQNLLHQYVTYIKDINNIAETATENDDELTSLLIKLTKNDSSVSHVWVKTSRNPLAENKPHSSLIYTFDTNPNLQIIYRSNKNKEIGIKINLAQFHSKIAQSSLFKDAYITLTTGNGITLFHPNEKLIGKRNVETPVKFDSNTSYKTDKDVPSTYLDIEVYRYSALIPFADTKLVASAYVPKLDFVELVGKMQQNLWLMIVIPILLLVLITSFAVYVWRKEFIQRKQLEKESINLQLINEKQRLQMMTSELENLKNGVNPHFLFNSLSSLRALIKRNPDEALIFAQSLSNMYRYLLDTEKKDTIDLSKELEFTENYIKIQKIRFKESIQISVNIDSNQSYRIPPLALQTLVENSIKHNSASINHPLHIKIYIANSYLYVTNNINRRLQIVESTGKGQTNLRLRYCYLTQDKCIFEEKYNEYIAAIPLL